MKKYKIKSTLRLPIPVFGAARAWPSVGGSKAGAITKQPLALRSHGENINMRKNEESETDVVAGEE